MADSWGFASHFPVSTRLQWWCSPEPSPASRSCRGKGRLKCSWAIWATVPQSTSSISRGTPGRGISSTCSRGSGYPRLPWAGKATSPRGEPSRRSGRSPWAPQQHSGSNLWIYRMLSGSWSPCWGLSRTRLLPLCGKCICLSPGSNRKWG